MCGRYALNLSPSQVRRMLLEQDMPVSEAPDDEGSGSPRQSYNFAPGYHGIVYRANATGVENSALKEGIVSFKGNEVVQYKLQSMKWGLVPFWTKRSPDYGKIMKTINCRDDSLSTSGGMWSTMKARKRCVVIAQGFFEWLKTGSKDKLPHYIKRQDGRLMCFAGLWDSVQYDDSDERLYTYTIVTTDANKQMRFIHDRMPVIFEPGSIGLYTWLDPSRREWSPDLQSLLKPYQGQLEIYPVTKDVGKVGNNSPSFVIPLDSKDNQSNIANFFTNPSSSSKVRSDAMEQSGINGTSSVEKYTDRHMDLGSLLGKRALAESTDVTGPPPKKVFTSGKNTRAIAGVRSATKHPAKSTLSPPRSNSLRKITDYFGN